jgi:hypothetical protein
MVISQVRQSLLHHEAKPKVKASSVGLLMRSNNKPFDLIRPLEPLLLRKSMQNPTQILDRKRILSPPTAKLPALADATTNTTAVARVELDDVEQLRPNDQTS